MDSILGKNFVEEKQEELLRYGFVERDWEEIIPNNSVEEIWRIRIVLYQGERYLDVMCNGKIIEISKLKEIKE